MRLLLLRVLRHADLLAQGGDLGLHLGSHATECAQFLQFPILLFHLRAQLADSPVRLLLRLPHLRLQLILLARRLLLRLPQRRLVGLPVPRAR